MQVALRRVGRVKHPNWSGIVKEIDREFDTTIKRRLQEYPKQVVESWRHKPQFPTKKTKSGGAIRMACFPAGPDKDKWIWVTAGTGLYGPKGSKYPIQPKKPGGVLAFPSVYVPKTKPGGVMGSFSGPGTSSGPMVFATHVEHPGIKPRKFVGPWVRIARVWFRLSLQKAVQRGAKKA